MDKEIAKKSETLTHVKVKPGGISKGDFDNYAVPYIKRVREETRKEERTKLRIVTNREEEKKKEERVKSEQVHKKEELAKKQHEEIGKKYHEAALKRDAISMTLSPRLPPIACHSSISVLACAVCALARMTAAAAAPANFFHISVPSFCMDSASGRSSPAPSAR